MAASERSLGSFGGFSLAGAFVRFWHDEFLTITVPRQICIQNKRMAYVLRFCQLCVAVALLTYSFVEQVWAEKFLPHGYGIRFQHEPFNASVAKALGDPLCAERRRQSSNGTSSSGLVGCQLLPLEETHHAFDEHLLLPTYVEEVLYWNGQHCSAKAAGMCGEASAGNLTSPEWNCHCRPRPYFTEFAALQRIVIFHGYEVVQPERIIRQSSGALEPVSHVGDQVSVEKGKLVTELRTTSGNPCSVNGRSVWQQSDAKYGISGSLQEWLACAGHHLDRNPQDLLPDPTFPANLREMGFTLQFTFDYHSDTKFHATCFISVDVHVAWTPMPALSEVFFAKTMDDILVKRVRKGRGVTVTQRVKGIFTRFSITRLLHFIVSFIVLFQVPKQAVLFVLLFCLGILSEVYRRARRTKISPYSHFETAITRAMIAKAGYQGLVGTEPFAKGIHPKCLLRHMKDLFADEVHSGIVMPHTIVDMAALTFKHLDATGKGVITCGDFLRSSSAYEFFDVRMMARFFSRRAEQTELQDFLDDDNMKRQDQSVEIAQTQLANRLSSSAVSDDASGAVWEAPSGSEHGSRHGHPMLSDGVSCRGSIAMDFEQRIAALEALQLQGKIDSLMGIEQCNNDLQLEVERLNRSTKGMTHELELRLEECRSAVTAAVDCCKELSQLTEKRVAQIEQELLRHVSPQQAVEETLERPPEASPECPPSLCNSLLLDLDEPVSALELEAPSDHSVAVLQSANSCHTLAMPSVGQKHQDSLAASPRPTWRSPGSDHRLQSQELGLVAALVGKKRESSQEAQEGTCSMLAFKAPGGTCSLRGASSRALEHSTKLLNCTRGEAQSEEPPNHASDMGTSRRSTGGVEKTFQRLNAALRAAVDEQQVPSVLGRSEWQTTTKWDRSCERAEDTRSWTDANLRLQ